MIQKEIVRCLVWSGVLIAGTLIIPGVGILFTIFIPLSFLYYFIKLDTYSGITVVGASILILSIISVLIGALWLPLILIQFSIISFLLSALFKRGIAVPKMIWIGTLAMFFINFLGILFWSFKKGMGPGQFLSSYITQQFEYISELYKNEGISADKLLTIKEYGNSLAQVAALIYPSIMFLGCGVTVWLNVLLCHHLFQRSLDLTQESSDLHTWSSPEVLIWPYIGAGFSLFLFSGVIKLISINLFIVLCGIYAFQGFNILSFYLNKYRIQNLLKGLIYFFVFFQQICWILLLIAGLFDQWFNFRRLPGVSRA